MWPLPITLITPIPPIQKNLSSYKKTAASQRAQPTSNQKTIFYKKSIYLFISIAPLRLPCWAVFGALWELSQVKQCATLKTFPKSRINPNCRVDSDCHVIHLRWRRAGALLCLRLRGNTSRANNGKLLPSAWSRCAPASLRCCYPSPYKWQGAFISFYV